MNKYIISFLAILGGVGASTAAALANGFTPCEFYGFCELDIVSENRELLSKANRLKEEIDTLGKENGLIIDGLKEQLESIDNFNSSLLTGFQNISEINSKGKNNEEKLKEIASELQSIGVILTAAGRQ